MKTSVRRREVEEIGAILARLHWQCWRADPPPVEVTDTEFIRVMPLVIRSGSVGLVWPRLRKRFDSAGAVAMAMEAAFQAQVSHNARVKREVAAVVTRLQEAGIEPLLIKGLAVAQLYPAGLVRPAGDIDLVVRVEDFPRAEAIVAEPGLQSVGVDIKHPAVWEECPKGFDWALTDKSEVGGVRVRMLDPQNQLRMLCIHFLKHAGQRPLWLCDVALAMESQPTAVSDIHVLETDRTEHSWFLASFSLANVLIGADIAQSGPRESRIKLQPWLLDGILRQWQKPTSVVLWEFTGAVKNRPQSLLTILRQRWPEPLIATIHCHGPIDSRPRLPWQFCLFAKRSCRFLIRLATGRKASTADQRTLAH